ncbi:unnamed protein product, partial [Scytosiphon promiscuus]
QHRSKHHPTTPWQREGEYEPMTEARGGGSMPVTSGGTRDVRGIGGSAASERGAASGASTGTTWQEFAGSRCLQALVVAVNQVSERSRWYTET